jgi:hypothetical protein
LIVSLAHAQAQTENPTTPAAQSNSAQAAEAPAAPPQEIVAVVQVTSSGLPKESADKLPLMLAHSVESGGHRAMPPDQINAFYETDLGQPLKGCVSVKCAGETGKLMGATRVLTGDVSQVGNLYRINLQLVNPADGKVMAPFRKTVPTTGVSLQAELDGAVKTLLAQASPSQTPVAVEQLPDSKAPTESPEQAKHKEDRFYKGNLTLIGPLEIIPRDNRAGVLVGYRRLWVNHYVHIEPVVDLRFLRDAETDDYKLRLGFGIPFNMQIFSGADQNKDGEIDKFDVKLRTEDWDSWRDAFQIIRYVQYGRKEDNLYLNINRTEAATIGHGTVTRWYIPNLDYFTTRVSAEFDGYSKYGGAELYTNDITRYNILSTLFFLKPGSFFSDHWMAESLSLGFHYSADYDAPTWVSDNRQNSDGSYVYESTDTHFLGADVELKVVRWPFEQPNVDVKVYADYTKWLDGGSGLTFGTLGRFNLYTKIRQAFRVRLEFRAYQDNYTPSYFDPFYEIMKYKWYSQNKPAFSKVYTEKRFPKFVEISSRPGDWKHFGANVEFSYALLDYVGLTMAFNRDSGEDTGDFMFHVEVPATKYFQVAATYYKANWTSVGNIFDPFSNNTMFIALARLRPVQILSFQFGVRKTPQPSTYYFPNVESVWDVKADLDLSWEF